MCKLLIKSMRSIQMKFNSLFKNNTVFFDGKKVSPMKFGGNIDEYVLDLAGGDTKIVTETFNLASHGVQLDWDDMVEFVLAKKNVACKPEYKKRIIRIEQKYKDRNSVFNTAKKSTNTRCQNIRKLARQAKQQNLPYIIK